MAIKYANWVWEGTSSEPKPDTAAGALDGQVYKELDTGITYSRCKGNWLSMGPGFSYIRATKSGLIVTDASGYAHVTFGQPVADSYTVELTPAASPWPYVPAYDALTASGFDIYTRDSRNGAALASASVSWLVTLCYNP